MLMDAGAPCFARAITFASTAARRRRKKDFTLHRRHPAGVLGKTPGCVLSRGSAGRRRRQSRRPIPTLGQCDLLVIARTEALIAGRGEAEALARAAAYEAAGGAVRLF